MSSIVGFQNTPSLSKGDLKEGFERLPSVNKDLELVEAKLTLGPLHLLSTPHITPLPSFQGSSEPVLILCKYIF